MGVVADDITGATDLAGGLVAGGTSVTLYFGSPSAEELAQDDDDCVVIALKSRSIPAAEAVTLSLEAARALATTDMEHLYFKYCSTFDSTASGNIGPVAEALARECLAQVVPIVPSSPSNGRTVYLGTLYVGDQLLEESSLRNHPLNPMHDSLVPSLLAPQVTWPVSTIPLPEVHQGAEHVRILVSALVVPCHVVIDAVTDADLDTIALAVARRPFSTGSAGLAAALARTRGGVRTARVDRTEPDGAPPPTIVLSGSTSEATRAQVELFSVANPTFELSPFRLHEAEAETVEDALRFIELSLASGSTPIVHSTTDGAEILRAQERLGTGRAAQLIEGAMARIAVASRDRGVSRMIVAGGEVSGAVVSALGVTRVTVHDEVAPGVPWVVSERPARLALLLKSGNFGGDDFFTRAVSSHVGS